jgi:hypothetical protein
MDSGGLGQMWLFFGVPVTKAAPNWNCRGAEVRRRLYVAVIEVPLVRSLSWLHGYFGCRTGHSGAKRPQDALSLCDRINTVYRG